MIPSTISSCSWRTTEPGAELGSARHGPTDDERDRGMGTPAYRLVENGLFWVYSDSRKGKELLNLAFHDS